MAFTARYKTLVQLFDESTAKHAARPIFGTKRNGTWTWSTYGDFRKQVEQCRAALASLGVKKGDRLAAISNNREEWAIGAYAAYQLGAAWVPMYEAQQAKEWKYIMNDCGASVCFCATDDIARTVRGLQTELPQLKLVVSFDAPASDAGSFQALLAKGAGQNTPVASVAEDDIAAYIYTSGTTGNPKGVVLTHKNLAYNVSAILDEFPVITCEFRSLSFLPWAHAFGQTAELHTLLGVGASLGICEGVPKIIDNLAEVKPSILMAVPNIFNRIYDGVQKQMTAKPAIIQSIFRTGMAAQSKLKRGESAGLGEQLALFIAKKIIFKKIVQKFGGQLKFAISGGAALSREVAEFVDNLGIVVFEGYGLTETSPVATCNTPAARRIGTVGKALPGVTITLDHQASGDKEEGEIVISGHNIMKGYYNQPDETAKVFTPDGGFRTGDLGKLSPEGFLTITGRIKELYKLENGKYVAPAALESKLQLSPYIAQAMVYGANRAFNVAVIVPNFPNLKDWAAKQGIANTDQAALVQNEKVQALLKAEVEKQAAEFKGFESIKAFHAVAEEFTVVNDLLTPKLSMKRRNVVTRYQAEIDRLYAK